MLNKFLKSLSLLLLLNLLIKPFWVLYVDRWIQQEVGDEAFGLFATLYSFTIIFSILLDPGLKNYFNTRLSRDHALLGKEAGRFLVLKLLLSLLFFGSIWVAAWLSGEYTNYPNLLLLLGLNQILLTFLLFFRALITGLGKYQADSFMSVTDRVLMILMALPIFFTDYFPQFKNIEGFVAIHTIGYGITTLICLLILGKRLLEIKLNFQLKGLGTILKKTFPFALFTGLMNLYIRADFIMIEQLMPDGFEQAGVYRKAYRFLEAASMFALLFGNLLLPIFSTIIHKVGEMKKMLAVVFKLFVIPSISLSLVCFTFRAEIMAAAYPDSNQVVADSFGYLMLDMVAISLFYLFGTALTARHALRSLNLFAGLGVLVNIGMNAILIPMVGIKGAVIATLATHGMVGILQMLTTLKVYNIQIHLPVLLRVIGFTGLSILAFFLSNQLGINWFYKLVMLSALSFTFAHLFRVFSIKEVFVLFKSEVNE